MKRRHPITSEETDTVVKMYLDRVPVTEIAKRTVIEKSVIYDALRRRGVTRTPKETKGAGYKLSESHKKNIGKGLKGKYGGVNRYWQTAPLKDGHAQMSDDLAYLIGVMLGDGYVQKRAIGLETTDLDFADAFAGAIERQFGIVGSRYSRDRGAMTDWRNGKTYIRKPTHRVIANSWMLCEFFGKLDLIGTVPAMSISQKTSFARGLWDSEGSVGSYGGDNSSPMNAVTLTHNSKVVCELFGSLLIELCEITGKYSSRGKQMNWQWYIYRKDYIQRFYEVIQPTIARKRAKFEEIIEPRKPIAGQEYLPFEPTT